MPRRRIFLGAVIFVLAAGLVEPLSTLLRGPVLAWELAGVREADDWSGVSGEQWRWIANIEVTNLTSSEVIFVGRADKTDVQIAGSWRDLGITSLLGGALGSHEARTITLFIPQRTQAFRTIIYYERDPLWSIVDTFLRGRGIYVSDRIFTFCRKAEGKLPGHFRRLVIDVKIPSTTRKFDESTTT